MFQIKVVEEIKTHILYSITFIESRAFINVKKYGGAGEATNDVTIWHICVACWIS
jgi:hypothetical protein